MNWQTYKFRCHSLGKIMAKAEPGTLPAGAITECHIIHRSMNWRRRPKIKSKYLEKGNMREEDGITMVSLHEKKLLNKNKERIENEFFTGEPDLYYGESIRQAEEGWDTKCSWDWKTFPYPNEKIDTMYEYQNLSYMDLTGARKWSTVHCLVNTPLPLLQKELRTAKYRVEEEWGESPERYLAACKEIERDHIVDMASFLKEYPDYTPYTQDWNYDIPAKERLLYQTVEWDGEKVERMYARVRLCREYLAGLRHATSSSF